MTIRSFPLLVSALLAAGLGVAPARGADVLPTHRLSAALANEAVAGAVAACTKMGYPITAAVVDVDGVTQVLVRGDGAGIHTVQTAQDKAFTAVTYNNVTSAIAERLKTNGVAMKEPHLISGAGGLPLHVGNELVGALGVSGSPGQDEVCGNAGIALIRARMKS
jgi:uncharacterized protein GlcG (DUF336 family)